MSITCGEDTLMRREGEDTLTSSPVDEPLFGLAGAPASPSLSPAPGPPPALPPECPASSASSSSVSLSADEAVTDPDDDDDAAPEQPEPTSPSLELPPDNTHLLDDLARVLRSVLREPPSDESWARCEDAWHRAVALAAEAVNLPPVHAGHQRRQPNPANAEEIQRLYRHNRRRAVHLIFEGPSQTCAIPLQELQDYWGHTWSDRQADSTLLLQREPAAESMDVAHFSPEEVFLRLRKSGEHGPRWRPSHVSPLEGGRPRGPVPGCVVQRMYPSQAHPGHLAYIPHGTNTQAGRSHGTIELAPYCPGLHGGEALRQMPRRPPSGLDLGVRGHRLNLLPVNGAHPWTTITDKRYRVCGYAMETLPHVLGHCMRHNVAYTSRHNKIVDQVKQAASKKFTVTHENRPVGDTNLRPDLVLTRGEEVIIVDMTCPFENRLKAL
ncbi:hypothetical protein MTO96_037365 [Rhipicephalus appendiculatus]